MQKYAIWGCAESNPAYKLHTYSRREGWRAPSDKERKDEDAQNRDDIGGDGAAGRSVRPMAFAVNKQCTVYPCWGTNSRDTLYERGGNGVPDTIIGRRYGDLINANAFTADRDVLDGQRGNDRLKAQDGDGRDELYGGPGYDVCYIDEGDYTQGCDEIASRS